MRHIDTQEFSYTLRRRLKRRMENKVKYTLFSIIFEKFDRSWDEQIIQMFSVQYISESKSLTFKLIKN